MAEDACQALVSKLLCGELEEDDAKDMHFFRPSNIVCKLDENGLKEVVEHLIEGKDVTFNIKTRAGRSDRVRERRAWARFGDAANKDTNRCLTTVSTEEVSFESPRTPGSKVEEPKSIIEDRFAAMMRPGAPFMVCRTCKKKGYHWTANCPIKDLVQPTNTLIENPPTAETCTGDVSKSTYVPPCMRAGAHRSGIEMRRGNDENSVRVSNLSEYAREADLHELFSTFGLIRRAYVAIDQKTGVSRGFGFVNFVYREDAEKSINKLNGYGYDNLILIVEWATPRPN